MKLHVQLVSNEGSVAFFSELVASSSWLTLFQMDEKVNVKGGGGGLVHILYTLNLFELVSLLKQNLA